MFISYVGYNLDMKRCFNCGRGGISKDSLVCDEEECKNRVKYFFDTFQAIEAFKEHGSMLSAYHEDMYGKFLGSQMGIEFDSIVYQLIGLMYELNQMINGGVFSGGYANEKCSKIIRYASEWRESYGDHMNHFHRLNSELAKERALRKEEGLL